MPAGKYKNKTYPLRIDENILENVKVLAEHNKISANKQIEIILGEYVKKKNPTEELLELSFALRKQKENEDE